MGLVIDTNVFIAAERQNFNLASLADYEHYGDAYIAAISVSELLAGVYLAKTPALRTRRSGFVEAVIARMPVLDFTEEIARACAGIYARFLHPRSKPSGNVHDLQIAATAVAHGFAVLTNNRDDFKKVPGLVVECPAG